MQETIGIIGLGLVGTALSGRWLAAGRAVTGYDISEAQLRQLTAAGGSAASSAADVAAACDMVVLSLPTLSISAAVADQILTCLRPDSLILDTTTGSPAESIAIARLLGSRRVPYLDSLIGGSSSQVRSGEAIVMCGGDEAAFERCGPLLRSSFQQVFYLGPSGCGSRMKLVLNLVLGLNRAVLAEGLVFAESCGIEPAQALAILRSGPAWSRVMDTKGRRMVERDFEPEARLSQHLKDVRIILELGRANGVRLALSELHRQLLEQAEAAGYGASDNSAIICALSQRSPR